jgi:serine/threonine protein kinase
MLEGGEKRVYVKHFRYPHLFDRLKDFFRLSKGQKAWIAANGLRVREIPSVKAMALVERKHWLGLDSSFFIMEALETCQEMDRYILHRFDHPDRRRTFVKAFGQWLSRFHRMRLYHKDMKTCNILVSEKGKDWDFHLLDLEDVRLDEKVDERRLFRNLLQLNTSTPKVMTRTDRFTFFREYLRANPIVRNQKPFLRRLIKESKRRGLVYVSPNGVVIEPM